MITKQRRRDLLVDPSGPRWVVTDRGITWVTDRFVLARADLFKSPPAPKLPTWAEPRHLSVSKVRQMLATGRDTEVRRDVARTNVRVPYEGRIYAAGGVWFAANERVMESLWSAGLDPRFNPRHRTVTWWGVVRGKETLFALLMAKHLGGSGSTPFADLTEVKPS
jgi:hypothetical protein